MGYYFPENIPNSVNANPLSNQTLPPQSNLTSQPNANTQNIQTIQGNNNINNLQATQINNPVTIINRIFVIGIEGIEDYEGMKVVDIKKIINENNNDGLADCLFKLGVPKGETDLIKHYQKYDARSTK